MLKITKNEKIRERIIISLICILITVMSVFSVYKYMSSGRSYSVTPLVVDLTFDFDKYLNGNYTFKDIEDSFSIKEIKRYSIDAETFEITEVPEQDALTLSDVHITDIKWHKYVGFEEIDDIDQTIEAGTAYTLTPTIKIDNAHITTNTPLGDISDILYNITINYNEIGMQKNFDINELNGPLSIIRSLNEENLEFEINIDLVPYINIDEITIDVEKMLSEVENIPPTYLDTDNVDYSYISIPANTNYTIDTQILDKLILTEDGFFDSKDYTPGDSDIEINNIYCTYIKLIITDPVYNFNVPSKLKINEKISATETNVKYLTSDPCASFYNKYKNSGKTIEIFYTYENNDKYTIIFKQSEETEPYEVLEDVEKNSIHEFPQIPYNEEYNFTSCYIGYSQELNSKEAITDTTFVADCSTIYYPIQLKKNKSVFSPSPNPLKIIEKPTKDNDWEIKTNVSPLSQLQPSYTWYKRDNQNETVTISNSISEISLEYYPAPFVVPILIDDEPNEVDGDYIIGKYYEDPYDETNKFYYTDFYICPDTYTEVFEFVIEGTDEQINIEDDLNYEIYDIDYADLPREAVTFNKETNKVKVDINSIPGIKNNNEPVELVLTSNNKNFKVKVIRSIKGSNYIPLSDNADKNKLDIKTYGAGNYKCEVKANIHLYNDSNMLLSTLQPLYGMHSGHNGDDDEIAIITTNEIVVTEADIPNNNPSPSHKKKTKNDEEKKEEPVIEPVKEIVKEDNKSYMTGYKDKTFKPNNNIQRGEVAAILARINELFNDTASYKSYTENYQDINPNDWYINYVGFNIKENILKGYDDGFHPFDNMTRAEFCTAMDRMFRLVDDTNKKCDLTDIKDKWYEDSVKKLYNLGYINGYEDNTFRGNQGITRAEACKIINNLTKRLIKDNKSITSEEISKLNNMFSDIKSTDWYYYDVLTATVNFEYEKEVNVTK